MPTRTLTILVGIVATILVGWVVHSAASILQPLIIALLLCSMLQPIVRWLARRHIPPPVTVLILVTLLLLGFARTGVWVRNQIEQFVGARPAQPIPGAPVTPTPAGSGDATLGFDPGLELGLGLGLELAQAPGEYELGQYELTQELDTRDGAAAALDQETARDAAEDALDPGDPGDLLDTAAGSQEPPSAPSEETVLSAETTLADEGKLGSEDGTEGEDEGEAEEEPVQQVGWSGIRAFLNARIRDSNVPGPMAEYFVQNLNSIDAAAFVNNLLGTTVGFTRGLLLVVLYMLFIFAEQAIFRSKILAVVEKPGDIAETLDSIARGIQRYLSVKTVISLATGILCYSVLEGLSIPNAPLFGFLTFLLNFIPTFGSIASGILATLTAFATKGSWESVAIVAATYMAVNMFLGSYIEPRILGRELNLSPLVILVSVVVWAGLWGIAGTFLAVPLTATIQICLANNEATRPIAILLSGGPPREERRAWRAARKAAKQAAPTSTSAP